MCRRIEFKWKNRTPYLERAYWAIISIEYMMIWSSIRFSHTYSHSRTQIMNSYDTLISFSYFLALTWYYIILFIHNSQFKFSLGIFSLTDRQCCLTFVCRELKMGLAKRNKPERPMNAMNYFYESNKWIINMMIWAHIVQLQLLILSYRLLTTLLIFLFSLSPNEHF